MIKKIITFSDVHIRNMKRMEESSEMLSNFIDECKKICSEYEEGEVRIVCVGDVFHQKIDISNESNVVVAWFFRELNAIAKTIVVAGNHDFLMNNKSRIDSLTPIFTMCQFDNCIYLDKELGYESGYIVDENVVWYLYSSFSDFDKPNIKDGLREHSDKVHIGLIHGDINGATTDTGRVTENSVNSGEFKGLDFVVAGHIHKHQEIKKNGVKIVYCGSLIQQDNGENINGHGYVLWDVDNLSYKHYELPNDNYGYYKFRIENIDDIINDNERLINI